MPAVEAIDEAVEETTFCRGCRERYKDDEKCECCEFHKECCDCWVCNACNVLLSHEEFRCESCEECSECCVCVVCSVCDRRSPDENCDQCDRCSSCCNCFYCEECESTVPRDNNVCYSCSTCREHCSCTPDCVMSYSTNVLNYTTFHGQPENGLYFGVELEVQVTQSGSIDNKAAQWAAERNDWFILKEDGSLSRGFEIVTAPSDLRTHRREWKRLLGNKDLVRNLRSYQTNCCGLHVHASRQPLGKLTVGKIVEFMNCRENQDHIYKIASRTSEHYARVDSSLDIKQGFVGTRTDSRYEAVNLRNPDTIEFRIFRGTLSLHHVLADIEFVDAVCRWAMTISMKEAKSWDNFWKYATSHKSRYANFITYMLDKPMPKLGAQEEN